MFHQKLMNDKFIVYSTIEAAAKAFLKLFEFGKKLERM